VVAVTDPLPVEQVLLERAASAADIEAVAGVLATHGVAVEPRAVKGQRSGGVFPWLIEVTLAAPFAAFFASAASEAGKDAYSAAKSFLRGLARARHHHEGDQGGEGTISLIDSTGSHIVLPAPIPTDALRALEELDWNQSGSAYLLWDDERGRWTELDVGPHELD
jgi:hypothetical protein